jgi:hypothetical protein
MTSTDISYDLHMAGFLWKQKKRLFGSPTWKKHWFSLEADAEIFCQWEVKTLHVKFGHANLRYFTGI